MLRPIFHRARSAQPALRGRLRSWHRAPGIAYAACARTQWRGFCDGPSGMDMKDGIKSVAAALSALKYGPQAVRKITAMLGSSTSGTWPPGKKVKLVFREMNAEEEPRNFAWRPERQPFYEVVMKQTAIGNFEVFYRDKDGAKWPVEATKEGLADFLKEHSDHPMPELQVEWRPPTTVEKIQSTVQDAKVWLTGGGGATEAAVKDAQEKVERNGGKIAVSAGSARSLIDHKGYDKKDWPQAVDGLQKELQLSGDEKDALLNAILRDEGKAKHFREKNNGSKMTIQYIAYHTVCEGEKIHIVYGKHEESMEVSGEVAALPPENCIQYGGIQFAAWPPASPHSNQIGKDMAGLLLEVPSGWQLVDSSQEGFDKIRTSVIVPYGWHTRVLVTSGPKGEMKAWKTDNMCEPGTESEAGIERKGECHFQVTGGSNFSSNFSTRLLIQAHPSANHELVNNWKRYVQLSAQQEWSQRLGMIQGSIE